MNIFGIMLVKNEVDIITHTLRAAVEWCDSIYVLDNDSDDGTWELVQELARRNPTIVPFGRIAEPYSDAFRARVFDAYRHKARTGDWWCKLDADEIYVSSPRTFLGSVVSSDVVWAISLQYYFTERDLDQYEKRPESYDSALPPWERYHYYRADWSEPRFFRYREKLQWTPNGYWPTHMGRVCSSRIPLRHYQFRSPPQIKVRLATRAAIAPRGGQNSLHWHVTDWRSVIRDSSELHYDSGDGNFVIDESALPRHRDSPLRAAVKRLMHGSGLWP